MIFWVLAPGQDVLGAHVVGPLVDHPGPTLHPQGVATAQVGVEVQGVAVTLIAAALEVLILIEDNLEGKSPISQPDQCPQVVWFSKLGKTCSSGINPKMHSHLQAALY